MSEWAANYYAGLEWPDLVVIGVLASLCLGLVVSFIAVRREDAARRIRGRAETERWRQYFARKER